MYSTQTGSLETQPASEKKGIPGSTLKIIAITAMLIDHIGATILERLLIKSNYAIALSLNKLDYWLSQPGNAVLLSGYCAMRLIGRFGFPIFCFLLVEGFLHTRSRKKYALRLFLFCLISEVPFDLAIMGKWYDPAYQNVFFTLFIGLCAMCAYDYVRNHTLPKVFQTALGIAGLLIPSFYIARILTNSTYNSVFTGFHGILSSPYLLLGIIGILILLLLCLYLRFHAAKYGHEAVQYLCFFLGILTASMMFADFLKTDYAAMGVLTIMIMYVFRHDRIKSMLWGCIVLTLMSLTEITSFLMLIPISKYNGRRGLNIKYFFYAFYPVHLALLYVICRLMGLI